MDWLQLAALALVVAAGLSASVHVLLHKRSTRAAAGWIGLIALAPLLGPALYAVFGVNRVFRRLQAFRAAHPPARQSVAPDARAMARLMGEVTGREIAPDNAVELLCNGEEAYPAMLRAIEEAERSIALCMYIFDRDDLGRRFAAALGAATRRGVQVRVLVDGLGALYSAPTISGLLREHEVPTALFLASLRPWNMPLLNLRNHRKLLVVDGTVAFTGSMNLRHHHLVSAPSTRRPARDLMVQVRGPVVSQLLEVFVRDWQFTTQEVLDGPSWAAGHEPAGEVAARAVPDGPDEDLDVARWTFLGALATARKRAWIVTPYFLPESDLHAALQTAALRGVDVRVLLPERTNLPYMAWATRSELPPLLKHGVAVYWTRAPFDHGKLMVVDDSWAWVGSANWDPRSLRLNFELAIECYDRGFALQCAELVERKLVGARRATLAELAARPGWMQLRDGAVRLLKPYL